MLHALGYYQPDEAELSNDDPERNDYSEETVRAVDQFREAQGWRTTVPGYVDAAMVERLWSKLEAAGKALDLRVRLLEIQRIRR